MEDDAKIVNVSTKGSMLELDTFSGGPAAALENLLNRSLNRLREHILAENLTMTEDVLVDLRLSVVCKPLENA